MFDGNKHNADSISEKNLPWLTRLQNLAEDKENTPFRELTLLPCEAFFLLFLFFLISEEKLMFAVGDFTGCLKLCCTGVGISV